ncbi:MAG: 5-deoxy-glucuronate isomerase [Nitrososphaerota archaeon]|nr:5-deoxy-glucuronate isomerase [Candidatus Calditenuaceae archaeon]MDW8073204.1 5-deoxy-glucuronate isomerase [Nitrososphaerota archaeon]
MRGALIRSEAVYGRLERLFKTGDFSLYRFRAKERGSFEMSACECERLIFSTDGEANVNGERLGVRDMLYSPSGAPLRVEVEGEASIYVAEAKGVNQRSQFIKRLGDSEKIESGQDCYARHIYLMIGVDDPVDRFLAGYTEGVGGSWTSYPPHRHDGKPEAYIFYGMSPGFGVQLLMDEWGEDAYLVRDGDVVLIEKGYHPNVGTSPSGIKYAWVIAAPPDKRDLSVEIHPAFSSIPLKTTHLKVKEKE